MLWCLPLRDKSALSIARAFAAGFVALFGPPRALQSDRGSEFAAAFDVLCAGLAIVHRRGTLLNSQSQSRVECTHRSIRELVTKRTLDAPGSDVVVSVARAVSAINAAVVSDGVLSPFELAFGYSRQSALVDALRNDAHASQLAHVAPASAVRTSLAVDMRGECCARYHRRGQRRRRRDDDDGNGDADPSAEKQSVRALLVMWQYSANHVKKT